MKAFRITPLFLAICLAVVPFTAIIAHTISHAFVTEHHVHAEPIHDDRDEDHPVVAVYTPDFGPTVSSYHFQKPLAADNFLESNIVFNRLSYSAMSIDESPPPSLYLQPYLLSHPTHAPPIR